MTDDLLRLSFREQECAAEQALNGGAKLRCTRAENHIGQHQDFSRKDMYYTFDDGGSSGMWFKNIVRHGWGPAYPCSTCGVVDVWHSFGAKPADGTCFYCNLWRNRIAKFDPAKQVVINGRLYSFGDRNGEKPHPGMGFGGRAMVIKKFDGTVIEHNDVWHGGAVPEHFAADLPDTASFVVSRDEVA